MRVRRSGDGPQDPAICRTPTHILADGLRGHANILVELLIDANLHERNAVMLSLVDVALFLSHMREAADRLDESATR